VERFKNAKKLGKVGMQKQKSKKAPGKSNRVGKKGKKRPWEKIKGREAIKIRVCGTEKKNLFHKKLFPQKKGGKKE